MEDDLRIVAQCIDAERLLQAAAAHRGAVALVCTALKPDYEMLLAVAATNNNRIILIVENGEDIVPAVLDRLDGLLSRSVGGAELVDCVRKVARGHRCVNRPNVTSMLPGDSVGTRVRERLTPRELQIVSFIVQGCKNKEIAIHLGTKEQVVKNYLRSIYDKTGVSDRLELALFTIHHRVLAEAATHAGKVLQMRSA
ncbi:MAG: response regulator transcription factor [Acidobacteria bacterium]|nr:response regulator transcription factor [Acidobacteriota bacterium]